MGTFCTNNNVNFIAEQPTLSTNEQYYILHKKMLLNGYRSSYCELIIIIDGSFLMNRLIISGIKKPKSPSREK